MRRNFIELSPCIRETVVQVHGTGPFEIRYVNADDDPRTTKK
jgi:hypothetical protein